MYANASTISAVPISNIWGPISSKDIIQIVTGMIISINDGGPFERRKFSISAKYSSIGKTTGISNRSLR